MDEGILPNLARFREHAVRCILKSTIPPTTPPAWTTCFTGLNPGRHGIFDFTESPLVDSNRPLISSQHARGVRIWQIVGAFGKRSIVINVPMTYPPEPVLGDMISGMLAPGFDSDFTYPANLKHEIKAVCGSYIPNLDIPRYDPSDQSSLYRFLDDLRECTDRRIEAIRRLMTTRDWSFFFAVFIGMDRIQHLLYKYLVPHKPTEDDYIVKLRSRAIEEYQRIDRAVGEIIERAGDETSIWIVSDHGFGATRSYFNANAWLMDQGFLRVHPLPYLRKRLFHLAMNLDESSLFRAVFPRHLSSLLRRRIRASRSTAHSARSDLSRVIDWNRTQAYFASIPTQGIYINESAPGMTPEKLDGLKHKIRTRLETLNDPDTGERITDSVWFREDIYNGSETYRAPHIVFQLNQYSVLGRQHLGTGSWFTSCAHLPIGFHRPEGILMATGPGILPGLRDEIQMQDILPCVLYSAGLPIPDGCDGNLRPELFKPDFIHARPVQTADYSGMEDGRDIALGSAYSDHEAETVSQRLKNLGYLE